jgi:hypothetical protein
LVLNLAQPNWQLQPGVDPFSYQFALADRTPDGRANFIATVELAGNTPVDPNVLRRMFCIVVLSRLRPDGLREATENLADILAWQNQQVADAHQALRPPVDSTYRSVSGKVRGIDEPFHLD